MCFGKKNNFGDDHDDLAPRPPPGQYPQQRIYAPAPGQPYANSQPQSQPYYPQHSHGAPPAIDMPAELPTKIAAELPTNADYAPPPGPPPGFASGSKTDYTAPPPGAPPSNSKPQPWELAVPDTSLFPPPPGFFSGFDRSPSSNADEASANAGEAWCAAHPLLQPRVIEPEALEARDRDYSIGIMPPRAAGDRLVLQQAEKNPGVWFGKSVERAGDMCVLGYPPLYAVTVDSPLKTGRPKTVYFEVVVRADVGANSSLGLGFAALPYPAFRMPGWHRGSMAVHADDGHRYTNDRWGGKSCVEKFGMGETVGIGIEFSKGEDGRLEARAFFTRGGRVEERWDINEQLDGERDTPVTGVQGFHDLSCAIGTFGKMEFEVVFDPRRWKYKELRA